MRDYTLTVVNEMDHLLLLLVFCTKMQQKKRQNTIKAHSARLRKKIIECLLPVRLKEIRVAEECSRVCF